MAKKKGGRIPKTDTKGRGGVKGKNLTKRQVITKATEYTQLYSRSETPQQRQKRISDTLGLEGEVRSHETKPAVNAPVSNSASTLNKSSTPSPRPSTTVGKPVASHKSGTGGSSTQKPSPSHSTSGGNKEKLAKKYESVLGRAKKAVNKDMSAKERKDVVAARKQLKKMRKNLVSKGYGSLSKTQNKKGGYNAHGIYKALTGKKYEK